MSEPSHPSTGAEPIRYELEAGVLEGTLDWQALFGNDRPVEVEVGFGKGTFLREASLAYPDRNFFGIEPSAKYVRLVRGRAENWGRPNVRVYRGEANDFLGRFVKEGSVRAIHIYHPDPWPKRRHHKRRLVRREFLGVALDRVIPGGHIIVTTDHAAYFEFIREEVEALAALRGDFAREYGRGPGEFVTNFARKYMEEGREIHRVDLTRPGSA